MNQVTIVVEFEVKPEHRSQFIELTRGHARRSRDDGCLQFDVMLPNGDDEHVIFGRKVAGPGGVGRTRERADARRYLSGLDRRSQGRTRRAGRLRSGAVRVD
jgi:antibiotic biosynthesis monooxygenase